MNLIDLANILSGNKTAFAVSVLLILSSIEILPININPWSWVLKCIRKINGMDIIENKIDTLGIAVTALEDRVDEGQAIQARVRILRFGDELRSNLPKSKDSYDQVLDDITRYNQYCSSHSDFQNEMTVITSHIIEESYREHLRNNDFL